MNYRAIVTLVLVFEVVTFICSSGVNGFVLNMQNPDPCNIEPQYPRGTGLPKDPNFSITKHVPRDCKNGTFEWHYPRGHVLVYFQNVKGVDTKICFGEALGGEIFTIVDLTDGTNMTLPRVDRNHTDATVCTPITSSTRIKVRIDAPSTWFYIGALSYVVMS